MEFYLYISNFLSVFPVNQPPLLDHESSTHVASIEVLKLHEVIVNIDKAQDECAENTNTQECEDDEDFFIESNAEREKKHVVLTLSRTQRVEKYFSNNFRRFIITNLLLQLTVEGMNFFL